ncbi:MAG: hypothetical protein KIS92_01445 [Planctomycetota bacterium]|nr:hypothetical protein [Planctomycetota bacterium]
MAASLWNRERLTRRGFILIVVVGLLAVLLAVVVGFMSLTRTQVASVSHLRDKTDAMDLAQSSMDWAIANIANHVIDPTTQRFDPTKWVSHANDDSANGGGQWWYTPYDPFVKTLPSGYTDGTSPNRYIDKYMRMKDAKWKYMPADFFPDGSTRGRFCVQVVDANSALAINDWNEDCNPTQCQMAHMLMDGTGINHFEPQRASRAGQAYNGNFGPYRYAEGWRMATRTVRYLKYNWSFGGDYKMVSPNWITTNTSWEGLWGPEFNGWKNIFVDEAPDTGGNWYYQVGLGGHTVQAGADPDTGRCPVNVNTCEMSGNVMPMVVAGSENSWSFVLEGVFNVESLARIIKVGKFWIDHDSSGTTPKIVLDAQADTTTWRDASNNPLTAAQIDNAITHIEELQVKLAYWYQETMVRYFCARYRPDCYNHNTQKSSWGDWELFRRNGQQTERSYYQQFAFTSTQTGNRKGALQLAEAQRVKYAFRPTGTAPYGDSSQDTANNYAMTDYYGRTRFPYGLEEFRRKIAEDLVVMTERNNAWTDNTVVNPGYIYTSGDEMVYDVAGQAAYTGPNGETIVPDGELTVSFDVRDTPEIIPGKLDKRTANAIFDNIIPGKNWRDAGGATHFLLFESDPRAGVRDPITELYNMRVGRDEYVDLKYNRRNTFVATGAYAAFNEKGLDIVQNAPANTFERTSCAPRNQVPWRQLCFGPDSFSTELTTTSTTYWLVVTTEVVDAASAALNPTDPDVRTWYQAVVVVEIAPDQLVETDTGSTGNDWPATGLGYYRGQWPRRTKSNVNRSDFYCQDNGMKTASQVGVDRQLPSLPETTLLTMNPSMTYPLPPVNENGSVGTSELLNDHILNLVIPQRWVDYRGVSAENLDSAQYDADTRDFYRARVNVSSTSDKGRQTSKRVVIRRVSTLNQGM